MYRHEQSLRSKLLLIQSFINKHTINEAIQIVQDVTLQLINIYQIINKKIQDIEIYIALP